MGYRSDVGIKCEKNAFDMFMKAIKRQVFYPDKICRNSNNEFTIYWDCVKWCSKYPEVLEIENVMRELDQVHTKPDDGLGYHFVRVGDDVTDVEDIANEWDIDIYVSRTIDTYPREEDVSSLYIMNYQG